MRIDLRLLSRKNQSIIDFICSTINARVEKKWQQNLKFEPQIDLKQITEKLLCIEVIK